MSNDDSKLRDSDEFTHVDVSLVEATYDGLEMAGAGEAFVTPLNDEDAAALEQGIVDMFETLRSENQAAEETDGPDADVEPTFALLAELDRLWAQPLAA